MVSFRGLPAAIPGRLLLPGQVSQRGVEPPAGFAPQSQIPGGGGFGLPPGAGSGGVRLAPFPTDRFGVPQTSSAFQGDRSLAGGGGPQFQQPQGSAQALIPEAPTVPLPAAVPINFETGQNFPVGSSGGFIGDPPPIGLIGSEQALIQGAGGAVTALEGAGGQARQDILTGAARGQIPIAGAQEQFQPFIQGGQQAFDLQSALLGAQGPEAQAQAFQNFQQSPGQQFLQEEQERAIIRNAAATGGLGGGNVRQELQRRALGRAELAFGNRISQLGSLSGQGLQATGQSAQLASFDAQLQNDLGINLAQVEQSTGINVAQILENLGSGQAEVRDAAGVRLAQAIQTASGQLADLQAGQGAGVADIGAGQIANIGNLLIDAGAAQAQLEASLSTLLSNLAVGEGSSQAQIAANMADIESAGILGQTQIIGDSLVALTELLNK